MEIPEPISKCIRNNAVELYAILGANSLRFWRPATSVVIRPTFETAYPADAATTPRECRTISRGVIPGLALLHIWILSRSTVLLLRRCIFVCCVHVSRRAANPLRQSEALVARWTARSRRRLVFLRVVGKLIAAETRTRSAPVRVVHPTTMTRRRRLTASVRRSTRRCFAGGEIAPHAYTATAAGPRGTGPRRRQRAAWRETAE